MADNFTPVLAAFKSILANSSTGIDPAPQPKPIHIWTYPDDYDLIEPDEKNLPFMINGVFTNREEEEGHYTLGRSNHTWSMLSIAYLAPVASGFQQEAANEMLWRPWPEAMASILFANQRLNNTVQAVGNVAGNVINDWRVGNAPTFVGESKFFGVWFLIPVRQTPKFSRSA